MEEMNLNNEKLKEELTLEKNKMEESTFIDIQVKNYDLQHFNFLNERVKNCIHPHLVELYERELNRILDL